MFDLLRDLRFGLRLLVKSPVLFVTAVSLLAIGISANTLIFSAVNAILLRPLPVSHPENLVRIVELHPNHFITWDLPYGFCADAASRDAGLAEVICQGEADVAFSEGTSIERVRVHLVSPNFFGSLGVRAYLGRVLNGDDERLRAQNAVLSYDFWQRRFRGDLSIVGRKCILGGHPFTVVGVSPKAFNGLSVDTSPDLRIAASLDRLLIQPPANMDTQVFGRLRSGVNFERANTELDSLLHQAYEDETNKIFPQAAGDTGIRSRLRLESIAHGVSELRTQFSGSLEILTAGVALLLLMASANVAGLLLARSATRALEIGTRLALGASPGRIVRQLLTEGLLLSLFGGLAGLLLTAAGLPWLIGVVPPIRDRGAVLQPPAVHITIDGRVLAFAIGAIFITTVLFALSPALRSSRIDVSVTLAGGRTATRRSLAGHVIVAVQVAICTILLMAASLLVETLERMNSMNPGFDADRVVTFTIDPSVRGYSPAESRAFSKTLLEKASGIPGVSAASIASRGLMRGTGMKATFAVAGSRVTPDDFLDSSVNQVTPGYFASMGIRLLAGRRFNQFDGTTAKPGRVIVNQAFTNRFFAGRDPIGKRFGFAGPGGVAGADNEIIGVVSDAKYRSLREPIPPTVYSPALDGFDSTFTLHLRTSPRPESVVAPLRELLRSLDPEMPVIEERTLRQEVDGSLWQERLLAVLSTIFGAIAALLACIGLYGALDYAVRSRTREIGVRAALGAQPARIAGIFSRQAFSLTAVGLILGLCGYAAASVYIRMVLYELRPWEPSAVLIVVLLIVLIAAIATLPAANRAARTDPASALRSE